MKLEHLWVSGDFVTGKWQDTIAYDQAQQGNSPATPGRQAIARACRMLRGPNGWKHHVVIPGKVWWENGGLGYAHCIAIFRVSP